jgi:Meckel syndrome type 1 protein
MQNDCLLLTCPCSDLHLIGIISYAGMREHVVDTWRPVGSVRQQVHSFFVGGGPQLRDMTYVRQPSDWSGPILSKYAFRTQAAGQVELRTNSMLQKR